MPRYDWTASTIDGVPAELPAARIFHRETRQELKRVVWLDTGKGEAGVCSDHGFTVKERIIRGHFQVIWEGEPPETPVTTEAVLPPYEA